MSIRLIAKELYAARQREEALSKEAAALRAVPGTITDRQRRIESALRTARAERRRMEQILAGHIDRGRR